MRALRTIFFASLICAKVWGQEASLTQEKDYTRISVAGEKGQLVVSKSEGQVLLKSLDAQWLEKLYQKLSTLVPQSKLFKEVRFIPPTKETNLPQIAVELVSNEVQNFSFYQDSKRIHALDFWTEADEVQTQKAAPTPTIQVAQVAPPKKIIKKKVELAPPTEVQAPVKKESAYLDFRHGASFVWDYSALVPTIIYDLIKENDHQSEKVDITRKTPEYLYPIKDRNYQLNDQEAHLQLTINLFRKKKWGLMSKSISLFHQKYGADTEVEFNEYLKANAILRESLDKGERRPPKSALNLLETISQRTKNYDLNKAIRKYLIEVTLIENDYVRMLSLGKNLYVLAKENFDFESIPYAAQVILHSLSYLKQESHIKEIIADKTLVKYVPKQILLAYKITTLLKLGQTEDVIKIYEENQKSLANPVHEAILFNTAEAYFREANFEKAVELFDQFIKLYSFNSYSQRARLRIALSYDLLEKNEEEILALYRQSIDRSQDPEVSLEARIRYVGLRSVRKKQLDNSDKEVRVFLDHENVETISKDNQHLLWLVRLRTFIKDEDYVKAMSFLSALPLKTMIPSERRVFQADGAEVVHGIIRNAYNSREYNKVIQAWDIYKDLYLNKVAKDPYLHYYVADSYTRMGLWDGFTKHYELITKEKGSFERTFPVWVQRENILKGEDFYQELLLRKNLKLSNFEEAEKNLRAIQTNVTNFPRFDMYEGLIQFKLKDYQKAEKSIEKFLASENVNELLDQRELGEIVGMYVDSIYENQNYDKFLKISEALLNDTGAANSKFNLSPAREKTMYLRTEVLFVKNMYEEGIQQIRKFETEFKESIYDERMRFLEGQGLVKLGKEEEAVKVYQAMLADPKTGSYIKELVNSELTLMNIKKKLK